MENLGFLSFWIIGKSSFLSMETPYEVSSPDGSMFGYNMGSNELRAAGFALRARIDRETGEASSGWYIGGFWHPFKRPRPFELRHTRSKGNYTAPLQIPQDTAMKVALTLVLPFLSLWAASAHPEELRGRDIEHAIHERSLQHLEAQRSLGECSNSAEAQAVRARPSSDGLKERRSFAEKGPESSTSTAAEMMA